MQIDKMYEPKQLPRRQRKVDQQGEIELDVQQRKLKKLTDRRVGREHTLARLKTWQYLTKLY